MNPFTCAMCGSPDFKETGDDRVRCLYCNSLYEVTPESERKQGQPSRKKSTITIKSGANVTFGKNSDVRLGSEMLIEDGAKVQFLGKLSLIESSSDEEIGKAKEKLRKVREK